MAMVMPRARSSGALSMESKARYSAPPFRARTLVIAAVSVVLPWSIWPMVPTFMWGLVRSNFFLATDYSSVRLSPGLTTPRADGFGDVGGGFLVLVELHGGARTPLANR